MSVTGPQAAGIRQCAFCGKRIAANVTQCPFCREAVPQVHHVSRSSSPGSGRVQIRRGLLYMLLAAVIYYFAAGYAKPLQLPITIQPAVINYLSPLIFLGGLVLTLYGLILNAKS
jgi:hypothetical protein